MAKGNLISGEYRSKVGGYVGAKWKGKAYFRAYVVPKNPNTENQQKVRGAWKQLMAIGSAATPTVLKPYQAKKFKNMSELNRFMKINQPIVSGMTTMEASLQIFQGSAVAPTATGAIANAGAPCIVSVTPATQLGTPSKYVTVAVAYNATKHIAVAGVNTTAQAGQQGQISMAIPSEAQDEVYWAASCYVETEISGVIQKMNSNSVSGKITVA